MQREEQNHRNIIFELVKKESVVGEEWRRYQLKIKIQIDNNINHHKNQKRNIKQLGRDAYRGIGCFQKKGKQG